MLKDDENLGLESVTASGLIDATRQAHSGREVGDDEENAHREKMRTTQKKMYIVLSLSITVFFVF